MTILWAQHRTPRMIAKQFDRSMWLSVFKSHCFFCWGVGYSNVGVSLPLLNFCLYSQNQLEVTLFIVRLLSRVTPRVTILSEGEMGVPAISTPMMEESYVDG